MMHISHTFVQVAPDCQVTVGVIPPNRNPAKPTIPFLEYQLLSQNPYRYTLEDLIYEVHIRRQSYSAEELQQNADRIRAELFMKNHPCMRASMLAKKYGWGIHYDPDGRLAIYGMETEEYRRFIEGGPNGPKLVFAVRQSRA